MKNLEANSLQVGLFDCRLTRTFSERPTLFTVAGQVLSEQWQSRNISAHAPLTLFLSSKTTTPQQRFIRPLQHVLLERYCRRQTLNLDAYQDIITSDPDSQWGLEIDLHSVELLINDCGPLILDIFQQALIDYWNTADDSEQTPWQWYTQYLADQYHAIVEASVKTRALTPDTTHMAGLVKLHSASDAHDRHADSEHPNVSLLTLDLSTRGQLDADLAGALLIEPKHPANQHASVLLYTLTGQLVAFASRQAVLENLAQRWPQQPEHTPQVYLEPAPVHMFEQQARALIDQQLRVINTLAGNCRSQYDAAQLSIDIDRLTSMLDICNGSEPAYRQQLMGKLPDWLRNADNPTLIRFSSMLSAVAKGYAHANGTFWLDDVDDAEHFAYKKLTQQLSADHPDNELEPWDVDVINHQVEAAAIPGQDSLITDGLIKTVHFSLAQLAIANLGLLKPGQVELKTHSGSPLPSWFTEDYLRTLISELDIATRYPQMLRSTLLADEPQRQRRQRLLADQLATQLPALAMERHLNGGHLSITAVDGICQVFQHVSSNAQSTWVMRSLGFISEPGATPDQAQNTWLIEASEGTCVLYRPMAVEPLLEFADRRALFTAISTAGQLQDDLLQRLPATARRIYAHGGFHEPHLPFSVEDDFTVPTHTPAPPQLSRQAPLTDLAAAIYPACVEEAITRFEENAHSTRETRWARWEQLGWLLFNTLLPLAGATLARATWLVQMEMALIQYVDAANKRDPAHRRVTLANLLSSVALLVLSHTQRPLKLGAQPLEPTNPASAEALEINPAQTAALDYSWSQPAQQLSAVQRQALEPLQATHSISELGMPIISGAKRGLYPYNDQLWVNLQGTIYRVELDPHSDQPRIVSPATVQTTGPWLRRDQQGRWQLDLGLRLRGGMPRNSRIAQRKAENERQVEELRSAFEAITAHVSQRQKELNKLAQVVDKFQELTILNSTADKLRTLDTYWTEYLSTLKAKNAVAPLVNYKSALSLGLFQRFAIQWTKQKALVSILNLHKQKFDVYMSQIKAEAASEAPAVGEGAGLEVNWRAALQILDDMTPQLDDIVLSSEQLPPTREQLRQLDSNYKPEIREMNLSAEQLLMENPDRSIFYAHTLRLEVNYQKLLLNPEHEPRIAVLLDRFWNNLNLFKSQRLRLYALEDVGEELKAQLLRDMAAILKGAIRRLDNLAYELTENKQQKIILALRKDLAFATQNVEAAVTDYLPTATVEQLQQKTPGLIETRDQGLLLGTPREGDDSLVDIYDANDTNRLATYRQGQSGWEKVSDAPSPAAPAASQQSWARLLRTSEELIHNANRDLRFLESRAAWDYIPADIEDMLEHQQQRIAAQRDALRQRLSEDTAIGKPVDDSAQQTIDRLDTQTHVLTEQARTLRINAALRQAPRMGELEYLLQHNQVSIQASGARKLLPKVKGRQDDYFDEYEIRHNGQPLWYAHFHYRTRDAAKTAFVAGHLKSASQRYLRGQVQVDAATGKTVEVHRSPISTGAAKQYFFNL
ncbi:hypothetical protein [Pseudomonas sp. NUPR-001]|uniref:hypothetical protein n=1 Tax=Pseudomonas sp. NUPR-001 TaxID=3416058 RepID=UPI003F94F7F9